MTGPTSPQLRQALAYLVRDAEALERHLPGLHSRRRRPDRDGLRSIAPSGIPTHTVSDPTQATAMANLAADERLDGAAVNAGTPDFVVVDHVIRCVLLAGNSLAEAVRALGLIDPALRPAPMPQCKTCGRLCREPRDGRCGHCGYLTPRRTKETST